MIDFFKNDKINEIRDFARLNHIPIMLNNTANLLQNIIKDNQPKKILEIGTAIGYSAICMKNAYEKSYIKTCEINESRVKIAKDNLYELNLYENIDFIIDDAINVLEKSVLNKEKYDFIFLDGPKGQQYKYYPYLMELLNDNGILFVDDIYYFKNFIDPDGFVPKKHRTMVVNLNKFIDLINSNKNLNKNYYNIDEGVLVVRKSNDICAN